MATPNPEYRALAARLQEAERIIEALCNGEVDAIVGNNTIALLHLEKVEQALHESEKVIEESETKYSTLFQTSANSIFVHDMQGNILDANKTALNQFGYSLAEMRKLTVHDLHPAAAHDISNRMLETIAKQGHVQFEINFLIKSGEGFIGEVSANVLRLDSVPYIQGVVRDITERVRARQDLEKSRGQLRQGLIGTIVAVSRAVEARDPYTAGHQQRVARLARCIAQEMRLNAERIEGLRMGATIHDIGKIHLPAEILSNPGKLSAMEFELIKTHAQVGYDILKDIPFPWPVADIAWQHHERINGTGYPQGLKGDEICLEARIVAVADVVEAMSSHRPYRAALGIDAALEEIKMHRGQWFDPAAVDACLKLFREKKFNFEP